MTGRDNSGLIILMPIYNDCGALLILLPALKKELNVHGLRAEVLMVDDGSTVPVLPILGENPYTAIQSVGIRRKAGCGRIFSSRTKKALITTSCLLAGACGQKKCAFF